MGGGGREGGRGWGEVEDEGIGGRKGRWERRKKG